MVLIFLSVIAFIASIVLTVILYRKFITPDSVRKITPGTSGWATFFRFDHLLVENILKALYMFFAIYTALQGIALLLGFPALPSVHFDFGWIVMWIFIVIISVIIFEVLLRISFEFSLLTILIWKNTTAIRKTMEFGQPVAAALGAFNRAAVPTGVAPTAPNAAVQAAAESWICPKCGHNNRTGKFCAKCGSKKA